MGPRADGVDVVWAVTGAARGWVEWQLSDPNADTDDTSADPPQSGRRIADHDGFGFVPQADHILRVRIDGWQPGNTYAVRTHTVSTVDGRETTSAWKQVRTLDPEAAETSFVVWNDTHQRSETLTRLDVASPHGDFWVWNGDVCNNWNDPAELVPTILAPADRDVTDGRPMCFVWGNHDVRGPHAYRLPGIVSTPGDRPYYALRSGPVAAIFLHTGEDKPDDHPSFQGRAAFEQLRREQADWLSEQIKQPGFADAPYRLVFCHIPLRWHEEPTLTADDYAGGEFDRYAQPSRPLWHDALVSWGAQLVISGHTHNPAWFAATEEFPYAQLTGGGPASWASTWIAATADAESLTVTTHRLDCSVIREVSFPPLV